MAKATVRSVSQQSDKLQRRWNAEFAGKPRHTRDLGLLDGMISKAQALYKKSRRLKGEAAENAREVLKNRIELFTKERQAISEVKYERPEVAKAHALGFLVEHAQATWRRHFAGQGRLTRNLSLLEASIASLEEAYAGLLAVKEAAALSPESLENASAQLALMKGEYQEIKKLRQEQEPQARVSSLLAEANHHLTRYRVLFSGKPRAIANLAVLRHMLSSLQAIQAEIQKEAPEEQAENLALLAEQVDRYQKEAALIETAQETSSYRDKIGLLGRDANELFRVYQREYAGKDRRGRDLHLLSDVCDRLTDVRLMQIAISKEYEDRNNLDNLAVVESRLRLYEKEWMEIRKAKEASPEQAATGQNPPDGKKPTSGMAPFRVPKVKPTAYEPKITIEERKDED